MLAIPEPEEGVRIKAKDLLDNISSVLGEL